MEANSEQKVSRWLLGAVVEDKIDSLEEVPVLKLVHTSARQKPFAFMRRLYLCDVYNEITLLLNSGEWCPTDRVEFLRSK